jgi:hypothetical protein
MLDEKNEVNRLASAKEVMYGNKDTEQKFPFDVEGRKKYYIIYHEKVIYDENSGSYISLQKTRKFSTISIRDWENTFDSGKWFERRKKKVTILHDPILQAEMEGEAVGDGRIKNATELRTLVGKAKSASDFVKKTTTSKKGGES